MIWIVSVPSLLLFQKRSKAFILLLFNIDKYDPVKCDLIVGLFFEYSRIGVFSFMVMTTLSEQQSILTLNFYITIIKINGLPVYLKSFIELLVFYIGAGKLV